MKAIVLTAEQRQEIERRRKEALDCRAGIRPGEGQHFVRHFTHHEDAPPRLAPGTLLPRGGTPGSWQTRSCCGPPRERSPAACPFGRPTRAIARHGSAPGTDRVRRAVPVTHLGDFATFAEGRTLTQV